MARDKREQPRGLIAPLTQAQLAALRAVSEGTLTMLETDHRDRLLNLELVHETAEGVTVTDLGRQRLIADR